MPFDVAELLRARHGENFALHDEHLNPQLVRALKTIDVRILGRRAHLAI